MTKKNNMITAHEYRGGDFFSWSGGGGTKCEGRGSIVNERGEGDGSDYPLTGF